MRIFMIDDIKQTSTYSYLTFAHRLRKGLIRCGHDVCIFSYPDMVTQNMSSFGRLTTTTYARKAADRQIARLLKVYRPGLIITRAYRKIPESTILTAKHAAPDVPIVCWYVALTAQINPDVLAFAKHADWFVSTAGGENLQRYHNAGVKRCAFMPNLCDTDLEHQYHTDPKWHSEVLFTGTISHSKLTDQDQLRIEIINALRKKNLITTWGGKGKPKIYGMDYLHAICGSKIVLSINVYNDVRFYHSDRLINSIGCGAFVLAKHVPDSEILFQDKQHLRYFDTTQQCLELVDYYLAHEKERKETANRGMQHAHNVFNCKNIAQDVIDLATTGQYDKPWTEMIVTL